MPSNAATTIADAAEPPAAQPVTHPEEMLFALDLRLPRNAALAMRFRTTPAGLIATGIMTGICLAGLALLRRRR